MQISISKTDSKDPKHQIQFERVYVTGLNHLIKLITRHVWSPIIYTNGYRKTENFSHVDFLALDFDDTWTIKEAKAWLSKENLHAIIGVTKSHQIQKDDKPPRDRFRVIIPFHTRLASYPIYRENIARLMETVPADKACKDGARFFYPCRDVIDLTFGKRFEWQPYLPKREPGPKKLSPRHGEMPDFVRAMLREVPPVGMRNKHCFRIAAKLAQWGFAEKDCIEAVLSSAVDLPDSEKRNTARSGYRSGTRQKN